jgi:uncharacterized protein YecE (DUF72 family)
MWPLDAYAVSTRRTSLSSKYQPNNTERRSFTLRVTPFASHLVRPQVKHSQHFRIGTASWTLPKQHAHSFPLDGTHLQRCSAVFNCVEINSSFYRPHMRKTWERWAACTPVNFRFAVKIPKAITHEAKLVNAGTLLQTFLDECRGLGEKLGPLLVQLPPKLIFGAAVAHEFFTTLRKLYSGPTACEPRHASWFAPEADRLLRDFEIARVAADPPKGSPLAAKPGGWQGIHYYRLHGAPRTYYSGYSDESLRALAATLQEFTAPQTWVIFDNTALGHATANALKFARRLHPIDRDPD